MRILAIGLLATLLVAPTVDLIACPDGCTDVAYPSSIHQCDVTGAHGACNLCVNTIAVDRVEPPLAPLVRLAPIAPSRPSDLLSSPPPSVERPPRVS